MSDSKRLSNIKTPDNSLIDAFAMKPVEKGSLIIQNGVMVIYGAVSSGKSTLLGKLMKVYDETIEPMIFCFYATMTPDETTSYHISSYKLKKKPYFVQLPTSESMISFFTQFRYKRVKLSEMLLFMKSVFISDKALIDVLRLAFSLFNNLSKRFDKDDYQKRVYMLMAAVNDRIDISKTVYESDFVFNKYAKKRKIEFHTDPLLFVSNVAVSLSKGLKSSAIGVIMNDAGAGFVGKVKPIDIEPMIRIRGKGKVIELIPSVCCFDDVAQFPMLTTEHPCQFVKDLLAMTRRYQNTFIVCAQRHNLFNKSLRALSHVFWIGFGLIDDDIPRIASEIPSNLLNKDEFMSLYKTSSKPFTFFVYSNKLGFEVVKLG